MNLSNSQNTILLGFHGLHSWGWLCRCLLDLLHCRCLHGFWHGAEMRMQYGRACKLIHSFGHQCVCVCVVVARQVDQHSQTDTSIKNTSTSNVCERNDDDGDPANDKTTHKMTMMMVIHMILFTLRHNTS